MASYQPDHLPFRVEVEDYPGGEWTVPVNGEFQESYKAVQRAQVLAETLNRRTRVKGIKGNMIFESN